MRTLAGKRLGWSAAWALALVVGAPAFVEAQTTELFPFFWVRRERVPCAAEDPVYKLYRDQYFGYHPTCWRRFPDGWGCPSPEAPDAAQAFRVLPRDKPSEDGGGFGLGGNDGPGAGDMPGPGDDGRGPAANPAPPLPSDDRSPFDLDPRPGAAPNGNPPGPQGASRLPEAASPVAEVAPEPRPAFADAPELGLPPVTTAPDHGQASAPEIPPATAPGANAPAVPSVGPTPSTDPLLALPDPTVAPSGIEMGPNHAVIPPRPAAPPRRTSLIGGFFNNLGLRRR